MKKKSYLVEEEIETDVLVVGAGAGGMMAAISAAENGMKVTLCEIGNSRRSGGITGGNDHYHCYLPDIHGPEIREQLIREYSAILGGDRDFIVKRIDLTDNVLKMWENWGVQMKTNGHYEFVGHGWPGSTGKMGKPGETTRTWLHFSDNDVSPKIEKQVRAKGVHIMNRTMVTDLLKGENGRVIGAIAISTRETKLYVIKAKSIIINKGGVSWSRLYPPTYLIGNCMAAPGAGEGVMMAYRIGAQIQQAENCIRQVSLRFGPFAGKNTWIGIVKDNEGNPIAPPYLSEPDPELGDPAVGNADAVDHVWAKGKGPVWIDPRGISEEDERYMRWGFESEGMTPLLRWLDQENINVRKTRFELTTMQPVTLIQACVGSNAQTAVEGLYMLPFGFLSLSATGGKIAGESAAEDALRVESSDLENNRNQIAQVKQQFEMILDREGPQFADWREVQWAIWQTMHCYALPPARTEGTLKAGYNQLLRLRERTHQLLKASNPHDLAHCVEVLNLLDVAELVLVATKERKESRGQARRQDYPFINPMLDKSLIITQKEGQPSFTWR